MYYLGLVLVFLIDRLSKELVVRFFHLNQSLPVIKNIFHLTYIRNPGALWGMLAGARYFLLAGSVLIFLVLTYYQKTIPRNLKLFRFALGLIAGGVLGNLFDRLVYGSVIDFFDFRFWPVFNWADIFSNLGVFIIIILFIREYFQKKEAK